MFAVPQIPGVLHARAAGAGAARHHALLERAEGAGQAVVAAAAAVLHAPGPVGDGGSGAHIDRGGGGDRKQGESSADHDHGYPPNTAHPCHEHPAGPILPVVEQGIRVCLASLGGGTGTRIEHSPSGAPLGSARILYPTNPSNAVALTSWPPAARQAGRVPNLGPRAPADLGWVRRAAAPCRYYG